MCLFGSLCLQGKPQDSVVPSPGLLSVLVRVLSTSRTMGCVHVYIHVYAHIHTHAHCGGCVPRSVVGKLETRGAHVQFGSRTEGPRTWSRGILSSGLRASKLHSQGQPMLLSESEGWKGSVSQLQQSGRQSYR